MNSRLAALQPYPFEKLAGLKSSVSILVTEQNVRESLKAIDRGYVLENGSVDGQIGRAHV